MAKVTDASLFTASIGVNVAMDFFNTPYVNVSDVVADLQYLGVTTVRDALPADDAASLAPYATLAAAGIKFDFIAAAGGGTIDLATVHSELDTFETDFPGSIVSVEGMNEPNIYHYSYDGHSGTTAADAFQTDLYSVVTNDPLLAGIQVIDFAYGGVSAATYAKAGDQTGISDLGNIHVYPDGEGDGEPQQEIAVEQQLAAPDNSGHAIALTEFGYSTYPGADVTQLSQAQFEIDGLLDTINDGIAPTYLYELLDGDSSSSDTDIEQHYGQFDSDATTPKLAATAIHDLMTILADPGDGALPATSFAPSVAGLPSDAQTALLETSDGTVDLAIWDEDSSVNATLTVSFGAIAATAAVVDPITGSAPVQSIVNAGSISLTLSNDPLIVALTPPGTNSQGSPSMNAPCFATGTRLRGEHGEIAVEQIRPGDRLMALRAGRLLRVRWVGHRRLDCAAHPRSWDVLPIRVMAGAFGPSRPHRDLLLSPDHAVYVDGALIPIRYLLNGASIAQQTMPHVTYWHVELEAHDVVLAEGLPTESYLDTGNRGEFANSAGVAELHPDFSRQVWAAKACAPLVLDGERVVRARKFLLARAASLGFASTHDPDLRVLAGGRHMQPQVVGRWHLVTLPAGTASVRLVSRHAVPAETNSGSNDRRRLGVAISRVRLDGVAVRLRGRAARFGWHDPEGDGPGWRWTDGDAELAIPGGSRLAVQVAMTERYWDDAGYETVSEARLAAVG